MAQSAWGCLGPRPCITLGVTALAVVGATALVRKLRWDKAVATGRRLNLSELPAFEHTSLEVSVPAPALEGEKGTVELKGTLLLPPGASSARPVPAVLFIAGSGPVDRHESPFFVLPPMAAALVARCGVATLVYDKRGVGGSGGNFRTAGQQDLLQDAKTMLTWLQHRPEVRGAYVLGHSEGAGLACSLAASGQVQGAVLLAGYSQPGCCIVKMQQANILKGSGLFTSILLRGIFAMSNLFLEHAVIKSKARTTLWMREFLEFGPGEALRSSSSPTPLLAVTGTADLQTPASELELLAAAAASEPCSMPLEVHRIKGLSHIMRVDPSPTPRVADYTRQIAQTIDPSVCDLCVDWLNRQLQLQG